MLNLKVSTNGVVWVLAQNVLLDLLSSSSETNQPEISQTKEKSTSGESDLLDLLGGLDLETKPQSSFLPSQNILIEKYLAAKVESEGIPSITAFEKDGLKVIFEFEKSPDNPELIVINLVATNLSVSPISDFLLQAAVPKVFQLQLLPPTNNYIPANNMGKIQQTLKILNPTKSQLRMKLRISYISNGRNFLEQAEVNNIPQAVYM
ncbi:hypothetical protein TNCV_2913611 [Trichonephila clavipes]|nr:hypothetical protein TNCV_2913611 [Trichonephila clavipes]